MKDKGQVVIGWLMGGQSTPGFVSSIVRLAFISGQLGVNVLGGLPKVSGPRIADARNNVVRDFLNTTADWLFMIDDDMTFDGDALARLLDTAHPQDRPVVGGLAYAAGRDGYFSTIWTLNDNRHPVRLDDFPPDQIVQVAGTGAACLLVHRTVFEKIAETYGDSPWPWFQETSFLGQTVGEDFTFCVRAQEAGFPIHVDTGVEFGHEKLVNINREFVARWRANHRVVITGTGRCGTGYLALLFNSSGIPATHEGVYGLDGPGEWEWQRIEASWLAAPHLANFDGHVVHLVRDPLAVLNSLVGMGMWTSEGHRPYANYALAHLDEIGHTDPAELSMAFIADWAELIEPYADQTIRIEDLTKQDLAAIAYQAGGHHNPGSFDAALRNVPTDHNGRTRADLKWADLPEGILLDRFREHARRYGYPDSDG